MPYFGHWIKLVWYRLRQDLLLVLKLDCDLVNCVEVDVHGFVWCCLKDRVE